MTTLLQNIWPRSYCFVFFPSVCLYSFEIFTSAFPSLLSGAVFSGFSGISPPCVYLSVWTCSPGGIVGVGVLSGLIAVRRLVGRRAWLGRRWGENILSPLSSFAVSPIFCLSRSASPPPLSLTLYMTTQNDGSPAWLINRQRERWTGTKGKERGERASPTQVTAVLAWCLQTTSKPLDASRVRKVQG